jgi:hypothetical protein
MGIASITIIVTVISDASHSSWQARVSSRFELRAILPRSAQRAGQIQDQRDEEDCPDDPQASAPSPSGISVIPAASAEQQQQNNN